MATVMSGPGTTTPVGVYPDGASACGLLDMAGNVWEWCATKWQDNYRGYRDDNDLRGDVSPVLRGGAFDGDRRYVRCAYRSGDLPLLRGSLVGFRVVLAPGF